MTMTAASEHSDIPAKKAASGEIIEAVLMKGDLSQLSKEERVAYYRAVCESVGLNPLTQPFQYLSLQGKLTLYARKDATEQLRRIHGISVEKLETRLDAAAGVYIVTATGRDREGRTDASTGAVPISGLKGEALSNALMKAETKAKRRLTLSLAGLGWLDESEIEAIPRARGDAVDLSTGEIIEAEPVARTPKATRAPKWASKPEASSAPDDPNWESPAEAESAKVVDGVGTRGAEEPVTPPASVGEPPWLDENLPKIASRPNWIGNDWRWLTQGKADGDRAKWCSAVVDNPDAPASLKRRCEYVALRIAGLA